MILTNQQKHDAARAIIISRDMCGNEREAFNEWCADNGINPSQALYAQANFEAGRIWRAAQIAAGVNPRYIY